jgi:hypothetical protein
MKPTPLLALLLAAVASAAPEPKFRPQEIGQIEIGYGLAIADVDGDGKKDIVLADKTTIQWYQNPSWKKHVIAENLTKEDNVCVAAQDLDGDGKAEIAVGAGWNPGDTVKSGAVFYLIPPADRTQKWEAVKLHHEPTVHRMAWVEVSTGRWDLVVQPLHGVGNKGGVGAGAKLLAYRKPANPKDEWKTEVANDVSHITHNLEPVRWQRHLAQQILTGSKEGIWFNSYADGKWSHTQLTTEPVGELRAGKLPSGAMIATVEPFHGTKSAVYTRDAAGVWQRQQILDGYKDGHAVACADFLGDGSDQVMIGWRGAKPNERGIRLLTPLDEAGKTWRTDVISTDAIAVEDFKAADLDGDGKTDLIVAGRHTKNLMIFWNAR